MLLEVLLHDDFGPDGPQVTRELVTAGFKCALLSPAAQNTPTNTAIAHPNAITINPELCPFVLVRSTFATTPLPNISNIMVPINSPINAVSISNRFGNVLQPVRKIMIQVEFSRFRQVVLRE